MITQIKTSSLVICVIFLKMCVIKFFPIVANSGKNLKEGFVSVPPDL